MLLNRQHRREQMTADINQQVRNAFQEELSIADRSLGMHSCRIPIRTVFCKVNMAFSARCSSISESMIFDDLVVSFVLS
jgi:hypothetical protein